MKVIAIGSIAKPASESDGIFLMNVGSADQARRSRIRCRLWRAALRVRRKAAGRLAVGRSHLTQNYNSFMNQRGAVHA
jgi:hypothetical protein